VGRHRTILTASLLAWALFLRVLVPAGWMPSDRGLFSIEPCLAALSVPMTYAMHGGHHAPSHKDQHQGDCAFAPLQAGAAPGPDSDPVWQPLAVAGVQSPESFLGFVATGPPALPPPARGPPIVA